MRYVITRMETLFASGRAERDILFWKNVALRATFFQKDKTSTMLPQAKPASGSGTRPEAGFA